ncbi:hypothetical protein Cgig2_008835 [Carnegiea gigantea]|uniref:Uncharacterized protein n=1 Tax=Carnegiea gigantea TaxID=171969 RepID=A0A9Q1JRB5_9CARY|nr:hypothetical protein Cgig2_008835 [Carnegiea gigantea]
MRVTKHNVHVMLGLPMGSLEVVEWENEIDVTVEFKSLLNRWKQQWPERHNIPKCGELIDMIHGQVDEVDQWKSKTSRVVRDPILFLMVTLHILLTVSIGCFHQTLFRDGRPTTDLIITGSRWLEKIITELEELIPRACSLLKRVRKVAVESVSDVLIRDTPKRSKSRTPVLSQDSYESEGSLMQINTIEKYFVGS